MAITQVTAQRNFEKGLWLIGHDRIIVCPVYLGDGSPKDLTALPLEYVVRTSAAEAGTIVLTKSIANGKLSVGVDADSDSLVPNLVSILVSRADTYDSGVNQVLVHEGKYWHTLRTAIANEYIALFEGYVWITSTAAR